MFFPGNHFSAFVSIRNFSNIWNTICTDPWPIFHKCRRKVFHKNMKWGCGLQECERLISHDFPEPSPTFSCLMHTRRRHFVVNGLLVTFSGPCRNFRPCRRTDCSLIRSALKYCLRALLVCEIKHCCCQTSTPLFSKLILREMLFTSNRHTHTRFLLCRPWEAGVVEHDPADSSTCLLTSRQVSFAPVAVWVFRFPWLLHSRNNFVEIIIIDQLT